MKYIYIRKKGTLEVARHERAGANEEGVFVWVVERETKTKTYSASSFIKNNDPNFEIIPYELYRDITNGIIDAKLEALDDARYAFMKMHYEARKESRAKKLPIDEEGL